MKKVLVVILFISVLAYFLIGDVFKDSPPKLFTIEQNWTYSVPIGRLAQSIDFGDINNDLYEDVILMDSWGEIYLLDGLDGSLLNSKILYDSGRVLMEDVVGDEEEEIVVMTFDFRRLIIFDKQFNLKHEVGLLGTPKGMKISDLNNDGKSEIVIHGTLSGTGYISVYRGDLSLIWENLEDTHGRGLDIADLNNDGIKDVAIGGADQNIRFPGKPALMRVLDGRDGTTLWTGSKTFSTDLEIGDITGDNKEEIVFLNDHGNLFVHSSEGDLLWSKIFCEKRLDINPDSPFVKWCRVEASFRPPQFNINEVIQSFPSAIELGNLNNDGQKEIVVGLNPFDESFVENFYVSAFDGDGNNLWVYPVNGDVVAGALKLEDLNKDGLSEVIIGTNNPNDFQLFVVDNLGNELFRHDYESAISTIKTADFNEDGMVDFVIAGGRKVQVFTINKINLNNTNT